MRILLPASLLLLALVGCSRPAAPDAARASDPTSAPPPAPVAPSAPPASAAASPDPASVPGTVHVALSGEGLDFVTDDGRVRHLVFDVPTAQAVDAVTRAYGTAPTRSRNEECGAGPLDMATWPDGLTVVSQQDRFVGWSAAKRPDGPPTGAPSTLAGVGPGATRRDLDSAYAATVRATTLGQEFEAGGLYGVLDGAGPTARIEAMWAGTSCNFR